jgi:hypothetical protein
LEQDLRAALKAGEKEKVSTLRMLLSDLKNEEMRRPAPLDEDAFVAVARKAIKQRQESAQQFRGGGRDQAADREESEARLIANYLPAAPSEATLREAANEVLAASDLNGNAAMGPAIKALRERFGSAADGATISRVVREALQARAS